MYETVTYNVLINNLRNKAIKKVLKILFLFVVAIILILPLASYYILKKPEIQTILVQKLTKKVSEALGAKFSIQSVEYTFFNNIVLHHVFISDQAGDTLLCAEKITANIQTLSLSNRFVKLNKLKLQNADFHLYNDSSSTLNLQFIIDALTAGESTKPVFLLRSRRIEMLDSRFRYRTYYRENIPYGMNYDDMYVKELDIFLNHFEKDRDGNTRFDIRSLRGKEQSGFILSDFAAEMSIEKNAMKFNGLYIKTDSSEIVADYLYFLHNSYKDWARGGFITKVNMKLGLSPSTVHSADIAIFAPRLNGLNRSIKLSGSGEGTVNDLKLKKIKINFKRNTTIEGDVNFKGLPDFYKTFIFANIKKLNTTSDDIFCMNIPFFLEKGVNIPNQINKLGTINYIGNFTGFPSDFVTFGKLQTDAGTLKCDIAIKPDTANTMKFSGKIITENLQAGTLINNGDNLNNLSLNLNVNGSWSKKDFNTLINGNINKLRANNYDYTNIKIDGEVGNKKYNGEITVHDPNLILSFNGRFDFTKKLPEFDFTAQVDSANLFMLNIDKSDTASAFTCHISANFFTLDTLNMNGEIKITDAGFRRTGKTLPLKDLLLYTNNQNDRGQILLRSDYADGYLSGKYYYKSLSASFQRLLDYYLPSYYDTIPETTDSLNNFSVDLTIKNIRPILNFFAPSVDLSRNTKIKGYFNPALKKISLNASAYKAVFGKIVLNNVHLDMQADSATMIYSLSLDSLNLTQQLVLEDFNTIGTISGDSVIFSVLWNNREQVTNTLGNINAIASLSVNQSNDTKYLIKLLPSTIFYEDSLWTISPSNIYIDTSSIEFQQIQIKKENEKILISGKISENKEDKLTINLSNLDIDKFNLFLRDINIEIDGLINGKIEVTDYYHNPLYISDFIIDTLWFNGEKFGTTHITTQWFTDEKYLKFNSQSKRGDITTFIVDGTFYPGNKTINADIQLDKLRLNLLNPYMDFLTDIRGIASGFAKISGTTSNPFLNGKLLLQKTSFTIDYLKTRYSTTTSVDIKNNHLILDNITLYDPDGNKATVNGDIAWLRLRNWTFYFSAQSKRFLMLNTTAADNEYFFGKCYGSGLITIKGIPGNTAITVSARSGENSKFYIPMTYSESVQENNFLTFTNSKAEKNIHEEDNKPDTLNPGIIGLTLDFNLELTPDLEAQIIFDPKMGDLIKGKGQGNIKMNITSTGIFEMYGKYTFQQGDYLFTLQNVINKKFDIQDGGYITWNGDPLNADIDMTAIYRLRTSLSTLFNDTTYKKRIPVECKINLQGKLMKPDIQYDIVLPTVDPEIQNQVASLLINDDKRSIQFLSLLVINSFYPDVDMAGAQNTSTATSGTNVGSASVGVTASELLSNQLSNWLSKGLGGIDVGFNYRRGDQVMSDEYEVALSTQLLNNRVTIAGNLDMGGQVSSTDAANTNNLVGDFKVEVKLNKSGKLKVQAFNRTNDKFLYDLSPYTQGIGIFYREEFNSFGALINSYWNSIFNSGKSDKIPVNPTN